MKQLIKPNKLVKGDTVATVSLSWGGAGDEEILWRYQQGKKQLEDELGLKVIEMEHTLKGTDFVYRHPELRAKDLMDAFKNPEIKGIITCIGGIESIRMLPYIDYDVIKDNPKVFIGYSDTTTTHMICYKAGLSSIYGPTLLMDFAENNGMYNYTVDYLKRTLFSTEEIGKISPSSYWTSEYLPWEEKNKSISRKIKQNKGYELLQGIGKVQGKLIGGCIEVFDTHRGTELFPEIIEFQDAILFFETSEDTPEPWYIECALRSYGIMGILNNINGLIWGKPQDEKYYEAYKEVIRKVLNEFNCSHLPVLYNMNFGHTEPKICLPYGALAEIDCGNVSFGILESGVN